MQYKSHARIIKQTLARLENTFYVQMLTNDLLTFSSK